MWSRNHTFRNKLLCPFKEGLVRYAHLSSCTPRRQLPRLPFVIDGLKFRRALHRLAPETDAVGLCQSDTL